MSDGKECTKCKVYKPYSEYSKDASRKDGFCCRCKECYKEYYKQSREKVEEYYQQNREKRVQQMRQYYQNNRERIVKQKIEYQRRNKEKIAEYRKERRQNDPAYKLRCLVSSAIADTLRNNNGSKEGNSTWDALPYTSQQLREHLEAQFEEGMTWDNYGHDGWHIDHIYPQSLLPYESMGDDNFKLAWDLRNLRPLWAAENLSKGNEIIEGAEELLLEIKKDLDISREN